MEQIFCDETGFTGPDLLNPGQKYFGYASVRMEAQEASERYVPKADAADQRRLPPLTQG
jgi:hypothetical protein